MDLDYLSELILRGQIDGASIDPTIFWQRPAPPPSHPRPTESFVAPVVPPSLVPPPGPTVVPPAAAPIAEVIGEVLVSASRVAPLVGLLVPSPIGREAPVDTLMPFDFSPYAVDPIVETLPEVVVTASPPRTPPPLITFPFDQVMPPNWNDLLHGYDFHWTGIIPIPELDFGTGTDADRTRRYVELPGAAGVDPDAQPGEDTDASPRPGVTPDRRVTTAPDLYFDPLLDLIGFPFGVPAPQPFAPPRTDPRTDPLTPVVPDLDFPVLDVPTAAPTRPRPTPGPPVTASPPRFDPFDPIVPQAQPAPDDAGNCNCPKVETKADPKKSKKKKPRTVCYRGTYTERSNGLIKARKEQVPCR